MAAADTAARLADAVTDHLRHDVARLTLGQTVGQALAALRARPPETAIYYFYVVDADDRLCGVVPTRRLVLSPLDAPLAGVMVRQVVAIPAGATVLDACEFFIQHKFLAFPVVDADRRLLGTVDVTLYTDELEHLSDAARRDDLFQTIGVHLSGARPVTAGSAFRLRFPWLGCNLAAGTVCALLAGAFEAELQKVVALAYFIPVVLNLAESVSSQSVSLALQLLRGQRPSWAMLVPKLRGELLTGLYLGLGSGAVVALVALVWIGKLGVAGSLLGGIAGGVTVAALFGLSMPILLRLLRLDPRVAAGPIALACADVVTLLLYLNLARWLAA
jgi:magnesium transporter